MKVNFNLLRWSRQIHIYLSVILLVLLIFFGITGVTLNHTEWVAEPIQNKYQVSINNWPTNKEVTQAQVITLLQQQLVLTMTQPNIEIEPDFIFIDWQIAGESYQVEFDITTLQAKVFHTHYGWLAKFNDLHKGRHTNKVWNAIIDISGVLVVLFSFTGFILLLPNKKKFKPSMVIGILSTVVLIISALML